MKLLLIGPSRYKSDGTIVKRKRAFVCRLNLIYLAALTPDGFEIEVLDEFVEDVDFDVDCDIVGITAFTNQAPRAYTIATEFRKRGKTVVLGGIHVSSMPEEAKKYADTLVLGEAEYTWAEMIDDFKNNRLKKSYKSDKFHDLKGLPVPRYDLIKRDKYMAAAMPVQSSRGCPYNCDFCTVTRFFGGSYRFRPVDDVVRDIKATGSKTILFTDDNILANRGYAKELFTKLIPLKIRWYSMCTINLGRFPDLCRLAAESGCVMLCIGIESLSPASLESVNKSQNNVQQYYDLLGVIRKNGVSVQLTMILGLDGDDKSSFDRTLKFISDIKPYRAVLYTPMPFPGTKFTKTLEAEGRILTRDWSKYHEGSVVFQPKLMEKEELERGIYETVKNVNSLALIFSRSIAQPRRNIVRTFLGNMMGRSCIEVREYSNSGS